MSFRITAGKLEIDEHEIRFRCMLDGTSIDCTISRQAVRDLAGVYALSHNLSDLADFCELLGEIETIASREYEAASVAKTGPLKIGTADLLRYGFGKKLHRECR